jgi:hypothetical protein
MNALMTGQLMPSTGSISKPKACCANLVAFKKYQAASTML